jgi:diaminohydroxyphosphoribosylaminopyrimidine deaminase / 5-amino-6-(5-phosphoribosylamino)uracil reductase
MTTATPRTSGTGNGHSSPLYATQGGRDQEGDEIFSPFRNGCGDQPLVVAQLGQSLDGRIATLTGDSKYINGAAALRHLHKVRGTVEADDPLLTVRLVPGRHPVRVVLDPRGRVSHDKRCFQCGQAPTIVIQGLDAAPAPAGCEVIRLASEAGYLDPRDVVQALFARGLKRILVEGGARTISGFIDAGVVDRLHVLVAPMILGSGKPGLELAPIKTLEHALRPDTRVRLLEDGNVLFDCDLRHSVEDGKVVPARTVPVALRVAAE